MSGKGKTPPSLLFVMVCSALVLLCGLLWFDNVRLSVSRQDIQLKNLPASFQGRRIVQISDLHSASFGESNERLVRRIAGLKPDVIFVTGDLISSGDADSKVVLALMQSLVKCAPTYFSLGNHEQIHDWLNRGESPSFVDQISRCGVIVLDNAFAEWKQGDDIIRIYGYTCDLPYYSDKDVLDAAGLSYESAAPLLEKFGKPGEGVRLLLAHNPDYLGGYADWGADLVFSGHLHGGVIRIPFIGGLLSPAREWFPKYDAGLYRVGGTVMNVNRGLGNSIIPFRLFNPPDISLISLQ